jgi:hypothetical protein
MMVIHMKMRRLEARARSYRVQHPNR